MNRKSLFLIALLVLFISGCNFFGGNNCSMDRRIMVNILTDVFLLESQLSQHQNTLKIQDSIPYYYAGILHKHNITADEFDKAYECYLLDEREMVWIMDEVLSSLSIIQSRINERKPEEQPMVE
jgi:hypothetical protein